MAKKLKPEDYENEYAYEEARKQDKKKSKEKKEKRERKRLYEWTIFVGRHDVCVTYSCCKPQYNCDTIG